LGYTAVTSSDSCKTLAKTLGFKGRFVLFFFGFMGLIFPGWTAYTAFVAISQIAKDDDMIELINSFNSH